MRTGIKQIKSGGCKALPFFFSSLSALLYARLYFSAWGYSYNHRQTKCNTSDFRGIVEGLLTKAFLTAFSRL